VVAGGEILNFVLSCRVIGLGGERVLLDAVAAGAGTTALRGRIVETARNLPARHLYRDAGFSPGDDGWWTRDLPAPECRGADARLAAS
jgi:predicted enzyme involved in methoxymalonyl-ACP biosynthesis